MSNVGRPLSGINLEKSFDCNGSTAPVHGARKRTFDKVWRRTAASDVDRQSQRQAVNVSFDQELTFDDESRLAGHSLNRSLAENSEDCKWP